MSQAVAHGLIPPLGSDHRVNATHNQAQARSTQPPRLPGNHELKAMKQNKTQGEQNVRLRQVVRQQGKAEIAVHTPATPILYDAALQRVSPQSAGVRIPPPDLKLYLCDRHKIQPLELSWTWLFTLCFFVAPASFISQILAFLKSLGSHS